MRRRLHATIITTVQCVYLKWKNMNLETDLVWLYFTPIRISIFLENNHCRTRSASSPFQVREERLGTVQYTNYTSNSHKMTLRLIRLALSLSAGSPIHPSLFYRDNHMHRKRVQYSTWHPRYHSTVRTMLRRGSNSHELRPPAHLLVFSTEPIHGTVCYALRPRT